jgi:hypothetical protein
MPKFKSLPILAGAAALALAVTSLPATADIIKDASTTALGQGFGAVPRLLTSEIPNGTEFTCNTNTGGTLARGCDPTDARIQGNGLVNGTIGTNGETNVIDSNKDNLVNLSSQGITSAAQIRLLYNPSQQGGNPSSDIQDITLKFYNSSNVFVTSLDGGCGPTASCQFNSNDSLFFGDTGTNLGNGGVGFVLKLDAAEVTALNAACGVGFVNCATVAGEATIALANDGPDSFTLFSSTLAVPSPVIGHGLLVLLAVGGVLFGGKLLESFKKHRLQAV